MVRHAAAPQTGRVKISTAETATGAVKDSAAEPVAIDGAGVISGWRVVLTTGFTATVRDTDANGQVLLIITGADGTVDQQYPNPEHWRGFADGVHVTIAGTGSCQLEYRLDA